MPTRCPISWRDPWPHPRKTAWEGTLNCMKFGCLKLVTLPIWDCSREWRQVSGQATAKVPPTRARMAVQADCPCRRAVPVREKPPRWPWKPAGECPFVGGNRQNAAIVHRESAVRNLDKFLPISACRAGRGRVRLPRSATPGPRPPVVARPTGRVARCSSRSICCGFFARHRFVITLPLATGAAKEIGAGPCSKAIQI
jgi:hypothetical protein